MQRHYDKWRFLVFASFLLMLTACGGWTGPIVQPTDPQAQEQFSQIKSSIIEAQAVVLATYKSIPVNVRSGAWSADFAQKVYDLTSDLEDAIGLVEAAVQVGNVQNAQAQADAMLTILGTLRQLTQGDVSYGNEDQWRSTCRDIRPCSNGSESQSELAADQGERSADGRGWSTAGFGDLSHEAANQASEAIRSRRDQRASATGQPA